MMDLVVVDPSGTNFDLGPRVIGLVVVWKLGQWGKTGDRTH